MIDLKEIKNRLKYHAPSKRGIMAHEDLSQAAQDFMEVVNRHVPKGREKSSMCTGKTRAAPVNLHAIRYRYHGLEAKVVIARLRAWFAATQRFDHQTFGGFVLNGRSLTLLVTTTSQKGPASAEAVLSQFFTGTRLIVVLLDRNSMLWACHLGR